MPLLSQHSLYQRREILPCFPGTFNASPAAGLPCTRPVLSQKAHPQLSSTNTTLSPRRNLPKPVSTKHTIIHHGTRPAPVARRDVHFRNEAILVGRLALLPVGQPRRLRPHLLDVLKHHVHVSVESLDAREQLAVRPYADEHLSVAAHRRLQDGEGAGVELVLLDLGNLVLAVAESREVSVVGVRWLPSRPPMCAYVSSLRGFASSSWILASAIFAAWCNGKHRVSGDQWHTMACRPFATLGPVSLATPPEE